MRAAVSGIFAAALWLTIAGGCSDDAPSSPGAALVDGGSDASAPRPEGGPGSGIDAGTRGGPADAATKTDATAQDGGGGGGVVGGVGAGCGNLFLKIACVFGGAASRVSLAIDALDRPVVAFGMSGGVAIRRWSGTDWETLGDPVAKIDIGGGDFAVHALGSVPYAVGFKDGARDRVHVARFDAGAWTEVAGSPLTIAAGTALTAKSAASADKLYVAMVAAGGSVVVTSFDGAAWSPVGPPAGFDTNVTAVAGVAVAEDGGLGVLVQKTELGVATFAGNAWTLPTGTIAATGVAGFAMLAGKTGAVAFTPAGRSTVTVKSSVQGGAFNAFGADEAGVHAAVGVAVSDPSLIAGPDGRPIFAAISNQASSQLAQVYTRGFDGTAWKTVGGAVATGPSPVAEIPALARRGRKVATAAIATTSPAPTNTIVTYDEDKL